MPLVHATVVEFSVEPMQIPLQLRPILADDVSLFQGKNVALGRVGQVFCILSSGLSLKGGSTVCSTCFLSCLMHALIATSPSPSPLRTGRISIDLLSLPMDC